MKYVISILVLVVVITGAWLVFGTGGQEESADTGGEQAGQEGLGQLPEFALENYEGETVRSSDFAGKVLVVNSWATWCPFCVNELPDFAELQNEFAGDVVVIAIDRAESRARAKSFTDELGVSDEMVFLLDPRDSFYSSIGGFSMPETVFVDAKGVIRMHKRGPLPLEEMREKTLQLLERKS